MTPESRCTIRYRSVHEYEFAEILAGRRTFIIFYAGDGTAKVGETLIVRELADATGDKTGRELRADVTALREVSSSLVVGFVARTADTQSVYMRALAVYGVKAQLDKTAEECAELITALMQFKIGRVSHDKIAEEVADVENMLAQMRHVVGDRAVDAAKSLKLQRFEKVLAAIEDKL